MENSGAGTFDIPGTIFYTGDRVTALNFTDMDMDMDPDMLIGLIILQVPGFELIKYTTYLASQAGITHELWEITTI